MTKCISPKYLVCLCSCALALLSATGCETNRGVSLEEQIRILKQDKKQLTNRLEQSQTENKKSKEQIQVLSGLKPEVRLENLYDLQKIRITRYTNFYDKDKDGRKEKLIVYIQPIDEESDIVKASGTVHVQLWDLNKNDGNALIGQWHIKPEQLKELWFATLITINYRLTFDIADKIDKIEEPLIVKVTFTDYLTGKVFKEQKVINP